MKILVLNYEFPPLGGGASPVGYEISKRYIERGHQVDVVTMGFSALPSFENVEGMNVYRVWSLRRKKEICQPYEMLSFVLSAIRFLSNRLKTVSYDVCHTHFIIPTGLVALYLRKKFGLPYIVSVHGSDVPGYNPDRFNFFHKFTAPIIRKVCHNAATIVPLSKYLETLIYPQLNGEADGKIQKIPNGIDPEKFPPGEKKPILLATGRLLPRKGFQYLIQALSDEDCGCEIHICGDGPMLSHLKSLAKKSKTKVMLHGWVNNRSEFYRDLLGSAAIYVLVSKNENASVALLEGMSAGCAVVTSNVSGCPETIGDAGIQVVPERPSELRQALLTLIQNEDVRRKYQHLARQRVLNEFNWETIVSRYETLLNKSMKATSINPNRNTLESLAQNSQ